MIIESVVQTSLATSTKSVRSFPYRPLFRESGSVVRSVGHDYHDLMGTGCKNLLIQGSSKKIQIFWLNLSSYNRVASRRLMFSLKKNCTEITGKCYQGKKRGRRQVSQYGTQRVHTFWMVSRQEYFYTKLSAIVQYGYVIGPK